MLLYQINFVNEPELGERVEQIREASTNLADGDARTNKRIDELAASINGLYLKHGRPGREIADDDTVSERKSVLVKSLLSAAKVGASTSTHSRAVRTSALECAPGAGQFHAAVLTVCWAW